MLYPFYGSYTKIFTIFEPTYDLIHKIKHESKIAEKKKRKRYCHELARNSACWPACSRSAQAGTARATPSTQASLTAGPRCQLRLQAPATAPVSSSSVLVSSRLLRRGKLAPKAPCAPVDPLLTRSSLP